ncbi:uncharacterized protein DSM5745_05929 [Aspergillus mulundensis]|uniref:Uncharacterized protein n=1 Tax=Aspergillus mulundensis TaxID=1810919 RepID=A0A3D8RYD8_9EURO|nr:hypothetical protein DSM5745_05929 [Aspergillus mulundensis]RDW79077.1 hypothetical protein DSM5745_05929 [Aspergillus mulundensis]
MALLSRELDLICRRLWQKTSLPNARILTSPDFEVGNDYNINRSEHIKRVIKRCIPVKRTGYCSRPPRDSTCIEVLEDRFPGIYQLPQQTLEQQAVKRHVQLLICRDQFHPPGYAHFHMPDDLIVHLHYKSRLLWWIKDEDFHVGPPAQDDPYFVLSTDAARLSDRDQPAWPGPEEYTQYMPTATGETRRSSGPWSTLYHVKTLVAAAHVKMALLCLCQSLHIFRRLDWLWFAMLYDLAERKVPGERTVTKYQLDVPELQLFWDQLRGHVEVAADCNIFEPLLEYRARLMKENKLPHLLEGSPPPDTVFVMNKLPVTADAGWCTIDQEVVPWIYCKRYTIYRHLLLR